MLSTRPLSNPHPPAPIDDDKINIKLESSPKGYKLVIPAPAPAGRRLLGLELTQSVLRRTHARTAPPLYRVELDLRAMRVPILSRARLMGGARHADRGLSR